MNRRTLIGAVAARGEAYLLGIIELTIAALLAAGAFIPILSALGSLIGIGTLAITCRFSSRHPVLRLLDLWIGSI